MMSSSKKIVPEDSPVAWDTNGSFKAGTWKPGVSVIADVAKMKGPEETKERLKNTWTTLGVVSALLLTMTYPAIVQPPTGSYRENEEDNADPLIRSFVVLNVASFVMSLTVVIVVTILLTQIDLCCSEEHTMAFVTRVAPLHETTTGIFGCSVLAILAQVLVMVWYNSMQQVTVICFVVSFAFFILVAVIATYVAMTNRMEVEKHGKQIMAQLAAAAAAEGTAPA